jgi:hypothetical protein
MKMGKRAAALALALAMGLCGCKNTTGNLSKFDAAAYVDGMIKALYLGQYEQSYLDLVGIDEDEAKADYDDSIETEVEYFLYRYDIDYPTDELEDELKELYKQIYSYTKYEVVSAAQQEDGSFSVKVNVEPINICQLAESAWDKTMEPFFDKYSSDDLNAMTDAEFEEVDQEWARLIVDLYWDKMEEIGNEDVRSISLTLEKDGEGYYSLNEDDFYRLDDMLIDYADNQLSSVA